MGENYKIGGVLINLQDQIYRFLQAGYSINEKGVVFSKKGMPMKGALDKKGYHRVCVTTSKGQETLKVHRLVAGIYVGNTDYKPQVNHINGIKNDNRAVNLEWVTNKENHNHSFKVLGNSLSKQTRDACIKANSKQVINKDTGEIYISAKLAAEKQGLNYNTLRGRLNGSKINNTNLEYYATPNTVI